MLPDGTVVDMDGNVIGRLNEKGEVVDANGNVIGYVTKPGRTAIDENGNVLGVVMPNGAVVDANGNVVGYVDENGNVVTDEIIGKTGPKRRLVPPTIKNAWAAPNASAARRSASAITDTRIAYRFHAAQLDKHGVAQCHQGIASARQAADFGKAAYEGNH